MLTLKISKEVEQQLGIYETGEGTHTLDAVCRRFGICIKKHHNALDDAEMCGGLILAFKAALENGKVIPLAIEQQDNVQKEKNQRKRIIYFYSLKRFLVFKNISC